MKVSKIDKLIALDRELETQLKRLAYELHADGYAFTAGYFESLIYNLRLDLQLNQKQMKLFAEVLQSRAQGLAAKRSPRLVEG